MLQHINAKFDDFFYLNQKVATHPCKWQWQWWQWWQWCLWQWLWLWWWDDGDDLKDTVEWSSSLPCPWLPYLTHIYFLVLYLCLSVDKYETSFFCSTDFNWLLLTVYWSSSPSDHSGCVSARPGNCPTGTSGSRRLKHNSGQKKLNKFFFLKLHKVLKVCGDSNTI